MISRLRQFLLARGGRKLSNPWEEYTSEFAEYGPYAHLFDKSHESKKYYDSRDMSKSVMPQYGVLTYPYFGISSWVAPCATISGNVEIWQFSTIWYNVTIRADSKLVRIGVHASVQDNCVITEATTPLSDIPDHDGSTIVGHYVTVGYGSKLEACTVEPYCTIGANCVLLPGSYMEEYSELLPGSVLEGRVPSAEVWAGNPAKFVRNVTAYEKWVAYKNNSQNMLAEEHRKEFYLPSMVYDKEEQKGHSIVWLKPGFGLNEPPDEEKIIHE